MNAIALGTAEAFHNDAERFVELVQTPEAKGRIKAAIGSGLQTRNGELELGRVLGALVG